ncbi:unnamed protein product [Linum trigynum]|uniref:Secreted protein n=1 Tax=Linum trigynum TaxID=586398 RepID=A0AAV2CID7_9ROSI
MLRRVIGVHLLVVALPSTDRCPIQPSSIYPKLDGLARVITDAKGPVQLGCKKGLHQLILGNVARLCCFFMLGMEDPLAAALLDAVVRSVSVVASVNMGKYDVYLVSVTSRWII